MVKNRYNVYLRNRLTGDTVETLVENETHDNAYIMANEYNKGYNRGKELREKYPIDKYIVDIWKF